MWGPRTNGKEINPLSPQKEPETNMPQNNRCWRRRAGVVFLGVSRITAVIQRLCSARWMPHPTNIKTPPTIWSGSAPLGRDRIVTAKKITKATFNQDRPVCLSAPEAGIVVLSGSDVMGFLHSQAGRGTTIRLILEQAT